MLARSKVNMQIASFAVFPHSNGIECGADFWRLPFSRRISIFQSASISSAPLLRLPACSPAHEMYESGGGEEGGGGELELQRTPEFTFLLLGAGEITQGRETTGRLSFSPHFHISDNFP